MHRCETYCLEEPWHYLSLRTSSARPSALIESLPGYGKAKASKIMDELGISATRRVKGLGARQREQLLEVLNK